MQAVLRRAAAGHRHWLSTVLLLAALLAIPDPLAAAPCEYIVQSGDTLWKIAVRNGITLRAILQANPNIVNPDLIRVGQRLQLPDCRAPRPAPTTPPPVPPPTLGSDFPDQPPRSVAPPPPDLAAPRWQRAHDATINVRHPIEHPEFMGSGIVIGSDGRTFITAYHVIGDALNGVEAERVAIGPFADWQYTADVIATDPGIDMAVLRVREPDFPGFAVAPLGTSGALHEGDAIYTLSYPGRGRALVTGKGRYLTQVRTFHNHSPLIVTDAIATFGSSGGVAVNERGEVIGIISGGIIGRKSMRRLGYPDLTRATLIVPIDAGVDLLAKAGIMRE